MDLIFEHYSHIVCFEEKENKSIEKIEKGTTYTVYDFCDIFPQDDIVKRYWLSDRRECVAKQTLWKSSSVTYYRKIEDVVKDWHYHVRYDELNDKWYNLPCCDIHLLDKNVYCKYFNTNKEMYQFVNKISETKINNICL